MGAYAGKIAFTLKYETRRKRFHIGCPSRDFLGTYLKPTPKENVSIGIEDEPPASVPALRLVAEGMKSEPLCSERWMAGEVNSDDPI